MGYQKELTDNEKKSAVTGKSERIELFTHDWKLRDHR